MLTVVSGPEGRWQVVDGDGYVIYCGPEQHAYAYVKAEERRRRPINARAIEDKFVKDAIRRI